MQFLPFIHLFRRLLSARYEPSVVLCAGDKDMSRTDFLPPKAHRRVVDIVPLHNLRIFSFVECLAFFQPLVQWVQ